MSERCICPDYELRGKEYELWLCDGYWHLEDGKRMLIETDFDPPLTDKEIDAIGNYVYDWQADP